MIFPTNSGAGRAFQRGPQVFDLRDLLTESDLVFLKNQRLSVYDSMMVLVGGSQGGPSLCNPIDGRSDGSGQCEDCGIRRVHNLPTPGAWVDCDLEVQRYVAALCVQGRMIGLIGGQQVPTTASNSERKAIENLVNQEVRALKPRVRSRRRKRIIHRAKREIVRAVTPLEVRKALLEAVTQLFGPVRSVYFSVLHGDAIDVEMTTGDPLHARKLQKGEGHVGMVLEQGRAYYEPDLKADDKCFRFDQNEIPLPKTVFTVPISWGWDEQPGTVQIQSLETNAFSADEDRHSFERLARWAGRKAVKLALRLALEQARSRQQASEGWRTEVTDLLLKSDEDISAVLKTKRRVYHRFAEELKLVSGDSCIASSIRVLNPLTNDLAFAVCFGDAWTDEARETLYSTTMASAGGRALKMSHALYYPDVSMERNYVEVLPDTRSLWSKRFMIRNMARGVVSVDWEVESGCSTEIENALESLVTQFEAILSVIGAKEEVLFRDLENALTLRHPDQMSRMVRKLAEVFDAQHCALFLDRELRSQLTLEATTHMGRAAQIGKAQYRFGEGITGWVAEHRKTVSIRDTDDSEELRRLAARYGIQEPIVHTSQYRDVVAPLAGYLAALAAPIVARDRVIGVIRLDAVRLTDFKHEVEAFLQEIADRLAHEFDRIWIEEDATEKIRQLEQRARHNQAFREAQEKAQDFKDAARVDIEDAARSANADGAFIRIEDNSGVKCVETLGVFRSLQSEEYEFPAFDAVHYTDDIWTCDYWKGIREELDNRFGPKAKELVRAGSLLSLLGDDHQVSASMGLCFRLPPDPKDFSQDKAEALAGRVSAELKPALRLERQLRATTKLRGIGLAYSTQGDTYSVAQAVLSSAQAETTMEYGSICLYDPKTKKWISVVTSKELEGIRPCDIDMNPRLELGMKSRGPVFVDCGSDRSIVSDIAAMPTGPHRSYLESLQSWIGVPIRLKDELLGLMLLTSTRKAAVSKDTLDHLEIISHYAAAAISSTQSREKQLELAEPFALIGTMLGGFLHTMRNKMTGAKGFWDNLQNMPGLPEAATQRLAKLGEALRSVSDICHDLVLFAVTEGPKTEEMVLLNDLLDRTWLDLSESRTRGVHLKKEYDPGQPSIRGNPAQLETAISMLIQNSVEALPPDGENAKRVVRLQTRILQDGSVRLKVADSGCGMDTETKRQAFRPFFTTKESGNGLGLAVVAGIARRHKARIKVTTEKNWGTSISLFFPSEEKKRG